MCIKEIKLDFCDVLLVPSLNSSKSRKDIDLFSTLKFNKAKISISCIPICAANMDGVGNFLIAKSMSSRSAITCLTKKITHSIFNEDIYVKNKFVFGTFGVDKKSLMHIQNYDLMQYFDIICLDVANGYMSQFFDLISLVRERFPSIGIIAGNVVTPDGVEKISKSGADMVKIGIGSGSACTTRRVAGVGYPQMSAIMECKSSAVENMVLLMSDGGCVNPGDIAKAFAAGSDAVMLGGMLAGHDEGAEDSLTVNKGSVKKFIFSGSSSSKSIEENCLDFSYKTSEGRVVMIEPRGSIQTTMAHIEGGLRSACSYTNCNSIGELYLKSKIIRVNRQLNEYFDNQTIGY